MKYAFFALLVTLSFKSQANVLNVGPEVLWHCPGVFDALDEKDCPASVQSQSGILPEALLPTPDDTPMAAAPNDYTSRIYECQAHSVILKLKRNVLLPYGNYESKYDRYSHIHSISFDTSSTERLEASKQSLVQALSQLEQLGGSNQVEYVDCNDVADVNSRR